MLNGWLKSYKCKFSTAELNVEVFSEMGHPANLDMLSAYVNRLLCMFGLVSAIGTWPISQLS